MRERTRGQIREVRGSGHRLTLRERTRGQIRGSGVQVIGWY